MRAQRREHPYEAMLQSGYDRWRRNATVRVYRATGGRSALVEAPPLGSGEVDEDDSSGAVAQGGEPAAPSKAAPVDPRDYDVEVYVKLLRNTFAARLETAFTPEDFAAVFVDPDQLSLFAPPISEVATVLTPVPETFELIAADAPAAIAG